MRKFLQQWWLACMAVVAVGIVAGLMLRFAFNRTPITLASELELSDPRYKEVICGPVSLSKALGCLGINRSAVDVASQCRVTSRGVALSDLQRFANNAGAMAVCSEAMTWEDLLRLEGTAVLFVDGNHFLAADPRETPQDSLTTAEVRVYEQDTPARWLSHEELKKRWNGTALVITKAVPTGDSHGPRIEFDRCFIDHGVLEDRQTEYLFSLSNSGNRELSIKQVQLSCGCADHTLSKNLLAPGESALLKVSIDLSAKEGFINQHALVQTNDLINPISMLRMTGGVPRNRVVSSDVIRLEDLPQGGAIIKEFYVADPGFRGMEIQEARFIPSSSSSIDEGFSCSISYDRVGGDAQQISSTGFRVKSSDYVVQLAFKASAACSLGPFEGDVIVALAANDTTTTHKVKIHGMIVPDVYSVPRVALIALGPEGAGSTTIRLHSYSDKEIMVDKMWSDSTGSLKVISENSSETTNKKYLITAHISDVVAGATPIKKTVLFELNNGSIVSVPVSLFFPPK